MRVVALVSGGGTNLQAVLDAVEDGSLKNVEVLAVGADIPGTGGVDRGVDAGAEGFVVSPKDFETRAEWDEALALTVAQYEPDVVLSSGFMRILGAPFLERFAGRTLNTHPALLPSFPGAHGVRDALAYGVKVTGCTVHWVDAGVDTGPIIAQRAVEVVEGEGEAQLHERIKFAERELLVQTLSRLAAGEIPYPA
ncbi:phosphoribosylglycinamide formyltransferase [Galactobacter caseinivorans]|uniref:Phosphoribosylglycinamide formyltransferase n=1 Tax=Galactobacter caseinivorans TaxID=2676123 RepID=A0A496PG54_9MICC|nr:phosphoribosylglycinamide formyltransferase [Galactobacter caseinivorans]RKW69475.1 phosphoribosylglycinamide formyltransferase [Galactobacter caseinivorans]